MNKYFYMFIMFCGFWAIKNDWLKKLRAPEQHKPAPYGYVEMVSPSGDAWDVPLNAVEALQGRGFVIRVCKPEEHKR